MNILLDDVSAFIFDFDGVLTNNKVLIDEMGKESVYCNRSDGLAFNLLHKLNKPVFILSTEKNPVVAIRAKKLNTPVIHGAKNKVESLISLAKEEGLQLEKILYIGNDLNDYQVMKKCGFALCPSDAHDEIKNISDVVLKTRGGEGVIRELIEDILELDLISILYP